MNNLNNKPRVLVWDRPGGAYGKGIRLSELDADGGFLWCRSPTMEEKLWISEGRIPNLNESKVGGLLCPDDSTK